MPQHVTLAFTFQAQEGTALGHAEAPRVIRSQVPGASSIMVGGGARVVVWTSVAPVSPTAPLVIEARAEGCSSVSATVATGLTPAQGEAAFAAAPAGATSLSVRGQ